MSTELGVTESLCWCNIREAPTKLRFHPGFANDGRFVESSSCWNAKIRS